MEPLAHSANTGGVPQTLADHTRQVAALAAEYASAFGMREAGHTLGLLHDLGKAHPAFQRYLKLASEGGPRPPRGPDHKMAGTLRAGELGYGPFALALQGHHGGLQSPAAIRAWLADEGRARAAREALAGSDALLPELAGLERPAWAAGIRDRLQGEMLLRMLFSALVDADYTDTAAHFASVARLQFPDLATLWERFAARHACFGPPETPVDRMRAEIYNHCLAAAELPPGLFRLAVPTGGGKTLSGMAFALRHAIRHGLERIIVAVPYISITEQTADEYRKALGAEAVIELHSQAEAAQDEEGTLRLAAETWDAPIIVTTTVQLLESLFANRPQRARKIHRLARSVILLDEVQALPVPLLDPILDALKWLASDFGASVVFSTATQPAFDLIPTFQDPALRDIVPEPAHYYTALARVRYEQPGTVGWEALAAEMVECRQAMAVLNTKADAMALLDALEARGQAPLHLSTQLCGKHRHAVIEEIKRRLKACEPCLLVATQVVEAGVDIDFPAVYRAMAPLDSLIQAAGRCNREGRLAEGRVVIFETEEGHMPPGYYRTGTGETRSVLATGVDLNAPDAGRPYYQRLYRDVNTDAEGIQARRRALEYGEVAERFRLIPCATVPVAVTGYGDRDEVLALLERLERGEGSPREHLRRLQPYLVNIYRGQAAALEQQGLLHAVTDGLYRWYGLYDSIRGVTPGTPDAA
ncbi:MAG: CRISPR-associated helicase Cas3' [Chloroflexi bacterium]|nr:CRISPR-associated helicase Cas3' [Chloroflexota bacterium]